MRSLLSLLLLFACGLAQGQKSAPVALAIEELPRRPLDTVKTADPETMIITYSNNTFSYYRPTLHRRLKGFDAYKFNWDTTSVFSYRNIELGDIPDIVELDLVGDLTEFHAPMVGKVLSKYGPRRRRNHNGVDVPLKIGEPIYAAFEGKIRYAKYNTGGFGYLVIVRHPNGLETWSAHLSRLNCAVNDYVKAGQVIGYGGSTGRSRGPHLHFEMRFQDQTFDPEFLVDFETGQLKYQTFALQKSFFNIHSRASEILEEDEYEEALAAGLVLSEEEQLRIAAATADKAKAKTTSSGGGQYHTVASGDNLGRIAIKYGTTVDNICRLNGIKRTTVLQLKRRLRVK